MSKGVYHSEPLGCSERTLSRSFKEEKKESETRSAMTYLTSFTLGLVPLCLVGFLPLSALHPPSALPHPASGQRGGAKTTQVSRKLGSLVHSKERWENLTAQGSELSEERWLWKMGRKWLLCPILGWCLEGQGRVGCPHLSDLWLSWQPRRVGPDI